MGRSRSALHHKGDGDTWCNRLGLSCAFAQYMRGVAIIGQPLTHAEAVPTPKKLSVLSTVKAGASSQVGCVDVAFRSPTHVSKGTTRNDAFSVDSFHP